MTDIINQLAGLDTSELVALRERRPDAVANAQLSFQALLEPETPGTFSYEERYAIAAFVTGISQAGRAAQFYLDLLADEADEQVLSAVQQAIAAGTTTGPSQSSAFTLFDATSALGPRLASALDFAHLLTFHPKDASPAAVGHLDANGWSADDIVSLSQLISFLAFQQRVVHGISVLAGTVSAPATVNQRAKHASAADSAGLPDWEPTDNILVPQVVKPAKFVNHSLGWEPWVPAMEKSDLAEEHLDALIRPERADMPYFRLLARDPAALKARTLTDLDIFYNTEGGLARAERELAATVASRYNGCEYCASVHQARAKEEGGDAAAIDRLLDEGISADLGSAQWNAIRDAAVALTSTPFEFTDGHITALREVGLDDLSIIDVINSSAFFNWANRLMLTLGEPNVPKRFR
ncbi:MAG TPA: alkylhydroperoxidase domain protein [Corynebacterium sp.]|nr:alkylhydroperoxidase domain protein [Corynebacterium sp.]